MKTSLKTKHLEIKPFSTDDRKDLSELLTNERIKKTYMIPDFADKDTLQRMVTRFLDLSCATEHFVRGIYLCDRLIGFVNDVEIQNDSIELGYVLHPDHWGKGYATEMLQNVLSVLLSEGFSSVKTGAFSENTASIRVMEKCGMQRCTHTEAIEYRGIRHTCVYYEMRPSLT